jgi:hypothetical protein
MEAPVRAQPWSFSALNTFITCGEMYRRRYVTKDIKDDGPEDAKDWGTTVHKAFEDRMSLGKALAPLPLTLLDHEPYMEKLDKHEGVIFTELHGALDRRLMPVAEWYSDEIWFRVVVDFISIIRGGNNALLVDYKTGKQKPEEHAKQCALFAIYTWHLWPKVDIVDTRLYYTSTLSEVRKVYSRKEEDQLWQLFIPDLQQYREAFKTETFQKRPSGLCNGWCKVTDCEHWREKRNWRK